MELGIPNPLVHISLNLGNAKYIKEKVDVEFRLGPLENVVMMSFNGPNSLERQEKKVYCDKFAAESVRIGADLYLPGVKQIPNSLEIGDTVEVVLDPVKIFKRLNKKSKNQGKNPPPLKKLQNWAHVANGKAMLSTKDIRNKTHGLFVKNEEPKYALPKYRNSSLYRDGLISDQNLPANLAMEILAEQILNDKPVSIPIKQYNPKIYDTCAAPGHKTTALSEWLYFKCYKLYGIKKWFEIIAIDRSSRRLKHLERDAKRLSLKNIFVDPINIIDIKDERPHYLKTADYIMFDPPCSALGQRPKLYVAKSKKELENYPKNQRRLLKLVDKMLKPGAILMYNTCTVLKEENEGIVSYALDKLAYKLIKPPKKSRQLGQPGFLHKSIISQEQKNCLIRFLPTRGYSSGYFISIMKKLSKNTNEG